MRLYEIAPSGNSYKVRLFLSLLGQPAEIICLDAAAGALRTAEFLAKNPFGQVPVLEDESVTLRDSQAILVYLARRPDTPGAAAWLPQDAAGLARVQGWLSVAANEIAHSLAALRRHYLLGTPVDAARASTLAGEVLGILDNQLAARDWLVDTPSIADLAVYPYVALAPQARLDLAPYAAVRRWMRRIQHLPGYLAMPGMWLEP